MFKMETNTTINNTILIAEFLGWQKGENYTNENQDTITKRFASVSFGAGETCVFFADNLGLAKIFDSERDAIFFEEDYIRPEEDFLEYNTIPVRI